MINKKGFEFGFAWIFAIIVGAAVIFLAIFATTRFVETERTTQDTKLGKQFGTILNPVETSVETSKSTQISLPLETRIFNGCELRGTFGLQKISTATKSGIGEAWQRPGIPSTFHNKYLFSEDIIEGKDYLVFSKPFEMPFKIADILYVFPSTQEYCFVSPPNDVEEEIISLQLTNINITDSRCREAINVCFSRTDCEIDVSLQGRSVKKKGFPERVFFDSNTLLYAAIFSSPDLYECQLKRLSQRASELASLYAQKSIFLTPKGCSSNLESDLSLYAAQTLSFEESQDILLVSQLAENIGRKNEDLSCKLF